MSYVDGFVIAVPEGQAGRLQGDGHANASRSGGNIGATDYVECVGDDTPYGEVTSFPRSVQAKEDEVVIFSWIVYPSKDVRDACNKKVMEDPRLKDMDEGHAV